MGADIPLGLSHGRAGCCGRKGLKKKFEKFISALPPPNSARTPAPAYVADNGLALVAVPDATAFLFHLKLAQQTAAINFGPFGGMLSFWAVSSWSPQRTQEYWCHCRYLRFTPT